ncbi:MAG: DNA-binding response regulator [Acidobacteria bacterium]|nr:MAG: DNA-binding response regulator [Acidobacteriota bacterium]
MKVVIVDDEPLARSAIRGLVAEDPELTVAGECSGIDAAEMIRREQPDILFLDIQMPEVDGFQVIEQVGLNAVPAVIFVTAYDEHALRAFDVHALDYLVKPFDDRRFFAALLRAKEHARKRETPRERVARFLVRNGEKVLFIRTEDIDWIEAADYYVSLHAAGKTHLLRRSMAEIETDLDPDRFVRVHRSAIVNVDRVKEMHPLFRGDSVLILHDGTKLRLSRARRSEFERRLRGA